MFGLFKKTAKQPETMAEVQETFLSQAQAIADAQKQKALAKTEEAVELARQAGEAKDEAEKHYQECDKATTFLSNMNKMFE